MSSQGNNTSRKIQETRDAFFGSSGGMVDFYDKENDTGEIDYLQEILSTSALARELYEKFKKMDAEILYKRAMECIDRIESCQVKPEDLEIVEGEIALLLGAIEDLHKIKILNHFENDEENYNNKKDKKSRKKITKVHKVDEREIEFSM